MKKWLVLAALCISSIVFATPLQERKLDSAALTELSSELGLPADGDLVHETQKRWLRKPGQERWEMQELSQAQRNFVLKWATEQGLYAAVKPVCMTYDKALILGATTGRMLDRLNYLKELWNAGVRFKEIIWLTGDRPLDPRVDQMLDRATTESEAAHFIWEEAELQDEMRKLAVVFIAAPKKSDGSRPTTNENMTTWLTLEPEPCKALFVSTQPFCDYQSAVIETFLPESFQFDVVGPAADPASHPAAAAITLDSLARWLYQKSLLTKKS